MDLVRNIDTSAARQAIVKGMVAIARDLRIRVLAEGVETRAERDYLRALGVDLMQGYWFCKPAFEALGVIEPDAWD